MLTFLPERSEKGKEDVKNHLAAGMGGKEAAHNPGDSEEDRQPFSALRLFYHFSVRTTRGDHRNLFWAMLYSCERKPETV